MSGKTGSLGRAWIELEHPRPPKVQQDDFEPRHRPEGAEPSPRVLWWMRQLRRGWSPPTRWTGECDSCRARLFGVHLWEQVELITPLMDANYDQAVRECEHVFRRQHTFEEPGSRPWRSWGMVCSKCGTTKPKVD